MRPAWVGAAALVLLLGGVTVAAVWLRGYEPLEWAGGAYGADTQSALFYKQGATNGDPDRSVPKGVFVYRYRPRQEIRFGFELHNGGRFAVRIDGVEIDATGPLRIVGLRIRSKSHPEPYDGTAPPYTLDPGESVFIVPLLATGASCGPPEAGQVTEEVRLRYSYLRVFHRTQTISSPVIVGQACGQPGPLFARLTRAKSS